MISCFALCGYYFLGKSHHLSFIRGKCINRDALCRIWYSSWVAWISTSSMCAFHKTHFDEVAVPWTECGLRGWPFRSRDRRPYKKILHPTFSTQDCLRVTNSNSRQPVSCLSWPLTDSISSLIRIRGIRKRGWWWPDDVSTRLWRPSASPSHFILEKGSDSLILMKSFWIDHILQNVTARGAPSAKKTVARSLYYVTLQISLAWSNRFFKIWGHMKALSLLFHCRYDS